MYNFAPFFQCELYHWADILDMCDELLEKACKRNEKIKWIIPCDLPDNQKVSFKWVHSYHFICMTILDMISPKGELNVFWVCCIHV